EKFGLDFEIVAFAPPEYEGDVEFILILAKGRNNGVRLPQGPPPSQLRDTVLHSRLGLPLRALRRATKRSRNCPANRRRPSGSLSPMSDFLAALRELVLIFDGAFGTWVQAPALGAYDFV